VIPGVSRIVAIAMAGVLCFAFLVPMALQRHNTLLAIVVSAVYVAYAAANAILWQRMKRRA
jgi:amino acid transporter